MLYIKALALTAKKLLAMLMFSKKVKFQSQGNSVKSVGIQGKVLPLGIVVWNIKARAFTVQKLLERFRKIYRMTDRTKQYTPQSSISIAKQPKFLTKFKNVPRTIPHISTKLGTNHP